MRILFNHGLTAGELYTNTSEKIINKKWKWLNDTYGWCDSYENAIAEPFKYCLSLILNMVIHEQVRFKIPEQDAYIDFEIVQGDKFIEQRQNGRFSEIDFVESDFTGYFLNYYFKSKAYQKVIPIYLGGKLKQDFLNGINSGIKYYTIKDITLKEFIPLVQQKFNDFTNAEIRRVLLHGFRRMHSAIKFGCAISINSQRYKVLAYIGKLTLVPDRQIKEYSIRRDRKLRKIGGWKREPFDGYYYIGVNSTMMESWVSINKTSRTLVKFNNIIPRKLKEELYYKAKTVYIFRYKRKTFKGWAFWADELKIRNLEYIGKAYNHKFEASNITWKELIKQYEERGSIDI